MLGPLEICKCKSEKLCSIFHTRKVDVQNNQRVDFGKVFEEL